MKSGMGSLTPVLALVGLVGLGVGGYNWVSTGCPLGSCSDSASKMTATSMDAKKADGHCALCPSESEAAAVTTVAHTTAADCSAEKDCAAEAKGGDCCKGSTESCCQETKEVAEKTECSDSKSECPMMKAAEEAKATAVKSQDKPAETTPTKPS